MCWDDWEETSKFEMDWDKIRQHEMEWDDLWFLEITWENNETDSACPLIEFNANV